MFYVLLENFFMHTLYKDCLILLGIFGSFAYYFYIFKNLKICHGWETILRTVWSLKMVHFMSVFSTYVMSDVFLHSYWFLFSCLTVGWYGWEERGLVPPRLCSNPTLSMLMVWEWQNFCSTPSRLPTLIPELSSINTLCCQEAPPCIQDYPVDLRGK